MLDYRIETFITLCRERNYSKTAQKLCITQPAVTQHIQYLERYYNCKLFVYENKQLKLTTQGMILERMALGLNASTSRFKALIQELEKKERTFNFGVSVTVSEYMMPQILSGLLKADPTINLNVQVQSGEELVANLKNGDIECAFIEGPFNRQDFEYFKFATEDYAFVSSTKMEDATIDDLLERGLITREPGSAVYDMLTTELGKYGKTTKDFANHIYTNNVNLIKDLIENGTGLGLLYRQSIKNELEDGRLYEIPIDMNLVQEFHFVMLKDNIFASDYEDFYKFSLKVYEEFRNKE